MKPLSVAAAPLLALALAATAHARSDTVDYKVADAAATAKGKEALLDVPYYMKGQKHPAVAKSMGTDRSNRKTNAFNKSDEFACQVAFLSALKALQQKAVQMGADGVIDIYSTTKGNKLESADSFRCVVGTIISHVGLNGEYVTFKK